MSVINDGDNLAGTLVDINNAVKNDFDTTYWGTTDSVLIIGTAFSGTPGVATRIYTPEMGVYLYGGSYDAESRKSATLTAGITDAYNRGCRTIYAMRVGGKEIYKDFQLRDGFNEEYRLRIKAMYPSNVMKKCAMRIDLTSGMEKLVFYKPASKATIAERRAGVVSETVQIITNEINFFDEGLSTDSSLAVLVERFNDMNENNVLEMAIVDRNGVDVTLTPEARSIKIGSCFPGLYTIARDDSTCTAYNTLTAKAVIEESDEKPYASFPLGSTWRRLVFNTDVASDYPIFAADYKALKNNIAEVGITTVNKWDFMEVEGMIDRAWPRNDVDYEETELDKFEMYTALGQGFATTAKAISRGKDSDGNWRKPRIVETPVDDANHIVGVLGGVYSYLQTAEVKYRVLTCANADDKIVGPLPKANAFRIADPQSMYLFHSNDAKAVDDALLEATSLVDKNDLTIPRHYELVFHEIADGEGVTDNIEEIYVEKTAKVISTLEFDSAKDKNYAQTIIRALNGNPLEAGTQVMVFDPATSEGHLMRYVNSKRIIALDNDGMEGELYVIDNIVYVGTKAPSGEVLFVPYIAVDNETSGTGNDSDGDGVNDEWLRADSSNAYARFEIEKKDYILIESADETYVAALNQSAMAAEVAAGTRLDGSGTAVAALQIAPLGPLAIMIDEDNADETLIYTESKPFGVNKIVVNTGAKTFMTLEELAALLNEDKVLGKLFMFTVTENVGESQKDRYIEELFNNAGTAAVPNVVNDCFDKVYAITDRELTYDWSKYIPYKTSDNFARQLAQHCVYTSLRTKMTHGFIGLAPLNDTSTKNVSDRVDQVLGMKFDLFVKKNNGQKMLDEKNQPYCIGRTISIPMFQYQVMANPDDGYITTANGAAAYAGMVSTLPITRSSTYQPIALDSVDYTLSRTQLLALTKKGIVTVSASESRGLYITDGITMADSSEYTQRLMVERICDYIGDQLRAATESYIGLVNNIANRNALKTAIESVMESMVGTLIYEYDFEVKNLASYTSDANIKIVYTVFPINEIRTVTHDITVTQNS